MPEHSRLGFCTVCTVIVLFACMAAGCSSNQTPSAPAVTAVPAASTGGGNTIMIENFAFDPTTLTVRSGTVVTWINRDGASHTVVSDPGSPAVFSSDPLSDGASFSFTFSQPGTYPFHCSIHPSMKGIIVVQS